MNYRADIDGLRALAVISVVLFHFGDLDGGFVGVDIFLVISGFLITRLIHDDLEAGSFSIADFYVRRIRRILPAVFVVYIATAIFAFFFLFSVDAEFIGKALTSCVFFVSNIFFYNNTGYFEKTTFINPLLHMWSLSVEEQFYIALPLVLMGLRRASRSTRIIALGAIALASFAASVWMVGRDPPSAFFLTQYRAWEFLLGGLIAIGAVPAIRQPKMAEYSAALGLVLIAASVALLSKSVPFPGLAALPPCLGAVLIIHSAAHCKTGVARFLSTPPMRFVGLISYSLYLWHFPLFVAYKSIWGRSDPEIRVLLITLSFALAVASWRFVELPFRKRRADSGQSARYWVFGTAVSAMAAVAIVSGALGNAVRVFHKEPPELASLLSYISLDHSSSWRKGECFLEKNGEFDHYQPSKCLTIRPDRKNILIFGDSHAAHLWPGLSQIYPDINFLQATAADCPPVLDAKGEIGCKNFLNFIFTKFLPGKHLDGIILAGRWRQAHLEKLKRTALALTAFTGRVMVFGPTVEYRMALPRILAMTLRGERDQRAAYNSTRQQTLDLKLGKTLEGLPVEYVSVYRTICAPDCVVWAKDRTVPMQFDYGHLTTAGSIELARRLGKQLFP